MKTGLTTYAGIVGVGSLLLNYFLGIACGQQPPKEWKRFTSVTGGWTTSYPESWTIFPFPPNNESTLDIVNFPPNRRIAAVILPDGGARIYVGPSPAGITTIEQWIERNRMVEKVKSRDSLTLHKANSKTPLQVTEVTYEAAEGQENVDCYFEISNHLMVGRVIYWKMDRYAGKLRRTLHGVIENLRPLVTR